jgi:cytochrome c oxidase subunit 1
MTIGAFVIAVSVLVFLFNVAASRRKREEVVADPWDGRTLEWATSSPPPEYNFEEIPVVTSIDDLWHKKYVTGPEGYPVRVYAGAADERVEHPTAHELGIHMPSPSLFPLVAAIGLPVLGYGVIYQSFLTMIAGAVIVLFGFYGWVLEPQAEEHH